MIAFLLNRPVAVVLGFGIAVLVTCILLPTFSPSLLPELSIPQISLTFAARGYSAEKVERELLSPAREQLRRLHNLEDMASKAVRDKGNINLYYSYGSDMDFALLELENKLDSWVSSLPTGFSRPLVHVSSVNDFPIFELAVILGKDKYDIDFLDWSEFATRNIRRRLEQIPGIAFADVSGEEPKIFKIRVDPDHLRAFGCTEADILTTLQSGFQGDEIWSVAYGNYNFFIQLESATKNWRSLGNLIVCEGVTLNDLADFSNQPIVGAARYRLNGQRGVSIRLYGKNGSNPLDLKKSVNELVEQLALEFPFLEFSLLRDQASLLEQNIGALLVSLGLGLVFATSVLFVFYQNPVLAILIATTIPISLTLSLGACFLLGVTLNVFSLYGMIIGTGLVLDNGIVVVDNILFKIKAGSLFVDACVQGTGQLIGPILASAGTTCIVFLPLVLQDGLNKELFLDQLLTIAMALLSSVLVACFLLPVLFFLFIRPNALRVFPIGKRSSIANFNRMDAGILYLSLLLVGILAFYRLDKSLFPKVTPEGVEFSVNWSSSFHKGLNDSLSLFIWEQIPKNGGYFSQHIGPASFLLGDKGASQSGTWQYFSRSEKEKALVFKEVNRVFDKNFATASLESRKVGGLFEFVFQLTGVQPKLIRVRYGDRKIDNNELLQLVATLQEKGLADPAFSWKDRGVWVLDKSKLATYGISESMVFQHLNLINDYQLSYIEGQKEPAVLSYDLNSMHQWRNSAGIRLSKDAKVPLAALADFNWLRSPEAVFADKEGTYYPFWLRARDPNELQQFTEIISTMGLEIGRPNIQVENEKFEKGFWMILSSLLLLYLIMAIVFNSFIQPLVAMTVIPAGFSGAALALLAGGSGLDIIAITGVIVTSGVVVNDAILKLDMIKRLRKTLPRGEAIEKAGRMRFRAILLTSLTTILSMLPSFVGQGLGAELQRPLALTITGGLFFGTLTSIYFIPYLFKKIPWI